MELPREIPVMPLPGALLFPHALLPLYIFEPRYRQMLDHALERHRMLSVALIRPERGQWQSPEDFFHTAGVGLIRACVGRGDGTSNLILQGLERVRFTAFEQEAPFPIATINPLESDSESSVETEARAAKGLAFYSKLKGIERQWPGLGEPEMLADHVASTFMNDPMGRQHILEEISVNQRLRLVIRYLSE